MDARLALLRRGFLERARIPWLWGRLAYLWPRNALMAALAVLPALLLFLVIVADPDGAGRSATDASHVEATFARFITAIVTAATVAVSVAALVLGRELKGIEGHTARHEANLRFRSEVRKRAGHASVPMSLGSFLSVALAQVARSAARARASATPAALAHRCEGVPLADFLAFLEEAAERTSRRVDEDRRHPHRLLNAALDFEQEVTHHLARRYGRAEALPEETRRAMEEVARALKDVVVATRYVKTLDTQWGLSNMSFAVLLGTVPGVLAALAMVLLYHPAVPATWGVAPAGLLVSGALGLTLLPVMAIVSHLLRFVFVNQHTLPAEDFVLGPEAPDVVDDAVPSGHEPHRRRVGAT